MKEKVTVSFKLIRPAKVDRSLLSDHWYKADLLGQCSFQPFKFLDLIYEEQERAKFSTGGLIRILHWHQISLKGLLLYEGNHQGDYHALVSF